MAWEELLAILEASLENKVGAASEEETEQGKLTPRSSREGEDAILEGEKKERPLREIDE